MLIFAYNYNSIEIVVMCLQIMNKLYTNPLETS